MKLNNFKKILTLIIVASILSIGTFSLCVSAGNGDENLTNNAPSQQTSQENSENFYLQNHGIEREEYDEFLNLSGLNFNEMKDVLEKYPDINFDYIYKLSEITKNYWAHYKQESLTKQQIFFQALEIARALHLECDNVDHLEKLLEANLISLHDVDIYVRKGFDQEKNLSIGVLAKQISKIAAETYTDFFRKDFKSTGYSAHGNCSNFIDITGWTFDQIREYLGQNTGILGLEQIAIACREDQSLDFYSIIKTFQDYKEIKLNDVCYLYREIITKRGFGFKDLVEVVDGFEGLTLKDLIDAAESAKKSNKTLLEEVESLCA